MIFNNENGSKNCFHFFGCFLEGFPAPAGTPYLLSSGEEVAFSVTLRDTTIILAKHPSWFVSPASLEHGPERCFDVIRTQRTSRIQQQMRLLFWRQRSTPALCGSHVLVRDHHVLLLGPPFLLTSFSGVRSDRACSAPRRRLLPNPKQRKLRPVVRAPLFRGLSICTTETSRTSFELLESCFLLKTQEDTRR